MFENVLLPQTKKLLKKLKPDNLPLRSYLAGGTAVALYLGHRRSADLDFFTPSEFIEKEWEEKLEKELGFKLVKRDWQTLIGFIDEVKISLFGYQYKQINKKEKVFRVSVASLADLGAMKLDAIIGRGEKRDLIDIYYLAQKSALSKLFQNYQKKYGNLKEREIMLKKALIFFDEVDEDEMPGMLISADWGKIKKWLLDEVREM